MGTANYIDLRYPDGTHTGVRVDWKRGIIEVRKRGKDYYFDIAVLTERVEKIDEVCYDFDS